MKSLKNAHSIPAVLWTSLVLFALGLIFARAIFPEYLWLSLSLGLLLIAVLGRLIQLNLAALKGRTAAFGLNSAITVMLVISLVGVINFISSKHPQKLDLTKNKRHTLSDQTLKLVKGLQKPVKAVFFAKPQGKAQFGALLDQYKALNTKLELEYVDPDREPTRAKQLGIKKYNTLQLVVDTRDSRIEDPTEEKITNALIKLLKDKTPLLCAVTGHGERSFNGTDPEGYESAKKQLMAQAYEVQEINLVQDGKISDSCAALAILGPKSAYFEPEVKLIREFLANGGRALFALDLNLRGGEYAPELNSILNDWNIKVASAMVVDPLSRMLGVDASVPLLATFNREQIITKEFQGNCYFPFVRPIDAGGNTASGLTPAWLGQTTPKSWVVSDLKTLQSGQASFTPGKDRAGPITVAMAVEGKLKDSKASRNSRLVVFGTSVFMTNNFQRFGGNVDLFMNSVSWIMEDESLISIRAKDDEKSKIELSQKQGTAIALVTIFVIPLLTSIAGIVIWIRRKKL